MSLVSLCSSLLALLRAKPLVTVTSDITVELLGFPVFCCCCGSPPTARPVWQRLNCQKDVVIS
ncbi:Protein of unknown function [Pyronema omphalodes CBS 100304]|uniref:Secreted protein n=1 Tax=Pyronema omphalodes (strain CBS 100304) TaxID=1076935 RepID=U4LI48_PYROM|nr:Protein of unknown function [Pyronema omphalodes CBS 100304]